MSGRSEASWRHRFRLAAGSVLLAAGICGFSYAAAAARAQWMYCGGKYGFLRGTSLEKPRVEDAREAFELARRAMALYPLNWYMPTWAASLALDASYSAADSQEFDAASSAALWCAREAVFLNPYDSQARYVWAEALAQVGRVPEALEFWRGVVDREFWNPDNHTEYARLLLLDGTPASRALAVREVPFVSDGALKRRLQRIAAPPKPKGSKKNKK